MPISQSYSDYSRRSDSRHPSRQGLSPSPPHTSSRSSSTRRPVHQAQTATDTAAANAKLSGRISPTETRKELIDRVKSQQRATWLNNGGSVISQTAPQHADDTHSASPPATGGPHSSSEPVKSEDTSPGNLEAAMTIERPRSALHRGDFREPGSQPEQTVLPQPDSPRPARNPWLDTRSTPWFASSREPAPRVPLLRAEQTIAALQSASADALPIPGQQRARAASYTARPLSFILRPPTSPLVNETQNSDSERDDFQSRQPRGRRHVSPDKTSRRRTFSPGCLHSITQRQSITEGSSSTVRPSMQRENSFPYQAHQPRRSTSSVHDQFSAPGTPSARSRRPSMVSETSPLQRMPMIGRYEESILRGRMSSLPSRPLDFVAQIGVLGKGKCKPSLRCPPHVTVPFPAVFYNYGSRPGSPTSPVSDGPSPYVGMIDLDSNLKLDERLRRKGHVPGGRNLDAASGDAMQIDTPKRPRRIKTRDTIEHALPKGGYRIPEQGQLQIIIKNPNKTAVKLFLVPYDLTGMSPGEKTFVRQHSYSAGPILDMPLSARKNLGTDRPEAALSNSEDPNERPVLRYLIHLNICSPSKGKHYLYKSIRVVFANRVPDGKEKLRQEIQLPEPRFSPWKPEKDAPASPQAAPGQEHFSCGKHPARTLPFGNEISETVKQPMIDLQSRYTFPLHNALSRPPSRPTDKEGDVAMTTTGHDDGEALSPRSRPISPHSTLMESPTFRPSSRHTFERLSRAEYAGPGVRERTQSPSPGTGLLALQLQMRDKDNGGP